MVSKPSRPDDPDELLRVLFVMPRHMLARIEEWRWANRTENRSVALRELVEAGLAKKAARK